MKIIYKSILLSLSSVALLLLSACDVHQFPEPKKPEPGPDIPTKKMTVPISLVYMPDMYLWEHFYDPVTGKIVELYPEANAFPDYPGATERYDNTQSGGVLDVHVKAYLASNTSILIEEQVYSFELDGNSYNNTVKIDLPIETRYKVAVWSHLRKHIEGVPFYDSSDFNKISIIGTSYEGNTNHRDGFSGTIDLDTFTETPVPYTVVMTRPMGKFELLTLDLSEFLERETTRRSLATRASADEYNVIISFPYYFPSSYSLLDDRLENAVSGVSFKTKMTVTGVSEASLGFEYVLLNDMEESAVQARVDIYDPSYTHVAGSTTLTIPMKRDVHTLLRGMFLSEQGEGGVGIDPGFNGDHNVIW